MASKLQSQLSENSGESVDSGVVMSNGGVIMGNGNIEKLLQGKPDNKETESSYSNLIIRYKW